jgi:hypothetical protein
MALRQAVLLGSSSLIRGLDGKKEAERCIVSPPPVNPEQANPAKPPCPHGVKAFQEDS